MGILDVIFKVYTRITNPSHANTARCYYFWKESEVQQSIVWYEKNPTFLSWFLSNFTKKKKLKISNFAIFFCQMPCRLVIVNFFPFRILTENFLEDDVTSISFFRAFNLIFMRFLCEVEEAATQTHRDTGKTKVCNLGKLLIYFFVKSFSRNFSF